MRFGILGSLHARVGARDVQFNGPRQTKILAALLIDANHVVPMQRLVEVMWDEDEPKTAVRQIQDAVSGLRRNLADCDAPSGLISSHGRGYRISLETGQLDLLEFQYERKSADQYAAVGESEKAISALRRALTTWRGAALSDLPGRALEVEAMRLDAHRTAVHRQCLALELAEGRHHEIADELTAFVREHPFDEQSAEQAILALHRCGRRADALALYRELRTAMRAELGIDPSPALRRLEQAILTETVDPPVTPAPAPVPAAVARPPRADPDRPRFQLPADTRIFTGRSLELEQLITLAREAPQGTSAGMVVVTAIDGMAGVGKSALAVHAAHRIRGDFPDGQLFIDLQGHTAGLEPVTAGKALDWFLRSLGVPPESIPEDLGERAAYYRDRLADTRTLIILDNAATTAQVRPLLPATPGCLVLITSRKRLTGLDDAHILDLDVLTETDAVDLLHKVAGAGRIPAGHPSIAEVVALCGHVPLAIRITAARLRHHRALRVEDLLDQLREEKARLEFLKDEDRSVAAAFEASYAALPDAERCMFRYLGLVPGPDVDADAAANLTGADRRTAEHLLESLLEHNLLAQRSAGRYRFHDLIRVYARTLRESDPAEEQDAAMDRLLAYYVHAARAADRHFARFTRPGPPPAAVAPDVAPKLADSKAALAWLRAERDNLLAAISYTTAQSRTDRAIALTAMLAAYLQQQGPWPLAVSLNESAATAAHDLGDRLSEGNALDDLGRLLSAMGDDPAADVMYDRALAIYQDLGDRLGQANALTGQGAAQHMFSNFQTGIDLEERALAIYRDLGDRLGQAGALRFLGRTRLLTGRISEAADALEESRTIFQELGQRAGEGNALWDLSRIRTAEGDLATAGDLQERAVAIMRDLDNRRGEANVLWALGRTRYATGDYAAATVALERSLELSVEVSQRSGEAYALKELGRVRLATGDSAVAADYLERALAFFEERGQRNSVANAAHDLGRVRHATKDYAAAADLFDRALTIFHDLRDQNGQAEVLNSKGAMAAETGGPQEALLQYHQALSLARDVKTPADEARALEGIARCSAVLGDLDTALTCLRQAVALYQRMGLAETAAATAYLSRLEQERSHQAKQPVQG